MAEKARVRRALCPFRPLHNKAGAYGHLSRKPRSPMLHRMTALRVLSLTAAGFQSRYLSSCIQVGSFSSGLGAGNNRCPHSLQVIVLGSVLLSENDEGNDRVTFAIHAL